MECTFCFYRDFIDELSSLSNHVHVAELFWNSFGTLDWTQVHLDYRTLLNFRIDFVNFHRTDLKTFLTKHSWNFEFGTDTDKNLDNPSFIYIRTRSS